MSLQYLRIHFFRNYEHAELALPEEGALFVGGNGAGKTNLLEAIHFLHTGRSHRTTAKRDVISRGESVCSIFGRFHIGDHPRENEISYKLFRQSPTQVELNGKRLDSLSRWFGRGTIVSFAPQDIGLVHGAPSERRRYLDMFLSQQDPDYLLALISYRRNLAQRNALLQSGRAGGELAVYEERMAEDGAAIFHRRCEALSPLAAAFSSYYGRISTSGEGAQIAYTPSIRCSEATSEGWKNVFYNTLKQRRKGDFSLGFSSVGPHRDDLRCTVGGLPAKTHASQGQSRSVALALRLAAMHCLRETTGRPVTLLVDDAFAGLDAARRERVYPLVKSQGQLCVTSHSADIPELGDIHRYLVKHGTLRRL